MNHIDAKDLLGFRGTSQFSSSSALLDSLKRGFNYKKTSCNLPKGAFIVNPPTVMIRAITWRASLLS